MSGTLFVVATPIGNLGDASERCVEILRSVAVVACEDTRVTRTLLARFGVGAPTVALHEHNEREVSDSLVERLRHGDSIALVSDAGTPALSDPGAFFVGRAHAAGVRVTPIPGPSAVAAAISAAGFPAAQFHFAGFLPPAGAARRKALETLDMPVPVVLYEAPHRIRRTLRDLHERFGPEREVVVGRELSKKFEEVARLRLDTTEAWLDADAHREQGEYALVLAPGQERAVAPAPDPERVLGLLLEVLSPGDAARIAAKITGEPKNALYRKALEGRKTDGK